MQLRRKKDGRFLRELHIHILIWISRTRQAERAAGLTDHVFWRLVPFGRMLDRVADFVARQRMFDTGQCVGVAVSGGADSVFLLHALHELGPRWNLKLGVVHVEHGIRGAQSRADAEFVRGLAESFGIPFHIHEVDVRARLGNLEQAARQARHLFFRELIEAGRLDRVATGHTRNDQAETVLYRILRGSGLAGLAGILPVSEEGVVRPILELDRSEIESWLRRRGIDWREDSTNADLCYARNRLRHQILPMLRENFNPRLDVALMNLAALARDEECYWREQIEPEARNWGASPIVSARRLTGVPVAFARRLIRRAIEHVRGDLRQIDFAHVEAVLEVARRPSGDGRVRLPGVDVTRSFDWVLFNRPQDGRTPEFSLPIRVPGSVELPGCSLRITCQILDNPEPIDAHARVVNDLDWERVTVTAGEVSHLQVRGWRAGDCYQRAGALRPEKVKVLFQNSRIPLWERRKWPIITYNEDILWIKGFGAAAGFAVGPGTRIILRVGESFSDSAESSGSGATSNI